MLILTIRTDKPDAEIGLYDDNQQLAYVTWTAHRELGKTIHCKLAELLQSQDHDWPAIQGIVAYQGPGSFTGLRIGLTVANALAGSLDVPAVGAMDEGWITDGIDKLLAGQTDKLVLPEYGSEANITLPRK
jgi:tRNA threonylcarbamoyladenosine biosynthesis protein TsaB